MRARAVAMTAGPLGIVLAVLALPGAGSAARSGRAAHVQVVPRVGDVDTTFVYRGWGWRPRARVGFQHGELCSDLEPCDLPLILGRTRTDRRGRFTARERPAQVVPDTFVGYSLCFAYTRGWEITHCRASASITVVPASVTATPVRVERTSESSILPVYVRVAAEHFKAGEHLKIQIRYPDGRTRILHGRARRHGGAVGVAYARRGGLIRDVQVRSSDPDGTYVVRVKDWHGGEADTIYTVTTSNA